MDLKSELASSLRSMGLGLLHLGRQMEAVAFLTDPPLEPALKLGYKILRDAALVTIPDRLIEILGLVKPIGGHVVGKAAVSGLRWALGYSPTWRLALTRTDSEIPEGLFKQGARTA